MSGFDYNEMVGNAFRGMIRDLLARVSKTGLPGDHHFYITYKTTHSGVILPAFLKKKYPEEITIVLQNNFHIESINDVGFRVTLHFSGNPETLTVPFTAVVKFADPSVPFGLAFQAVEEPVVEQKSAEVIQFPGAKPSNVVNLAEWKNKNR